MDKIDPSVKIHAYASRHRRVTKTCVRKHHRLGGKPHGRLEVVFLHRNQCLFLLLEPLTAFLG